MHLSKLEIDFCFILASQWRSKQRGKIKFLEFKKREGGVGCECWLGLIRTYRRIMQGVPTLFDKRNIIIIIMLFMNMRLRSYSVSKRTF